tara:strand:- start:922 stop:1092 length:171 start_codon:yes stop_codon:yes gene_type:complete
MIVWDRLWKLSEDIHRNSDKSGNLTADQEKQIDDLDRFVCNSLDIDRKEFPDPDGG